MTAQSRTVEVIRDVQTREGRFVVGNVGEAVYWSEQEPLTVLVRFNRTTATLPADAVRPIVWSLK